MVLEEPAESRILIEPQLVGHLLNGPVTLGAEQFLGLDNKYNADPLRRGFIGGHADDR